jgi:hypothetical protein
VTFGPLKRGLREHRYPVTAAELIEQYGAATLETPTATKRLDGLLEGREERQFRGPSDVREAVLEALGTPTRPRRRPRRSGRSFRGDGSVRPTRFF